MIPDLKTIMFSLPYMLNLGRVYIFFFPADFFGENESNFYKHIIQSILCWIYSLTQDAIVANNICFLFFFSGFRSPKCNPGGDRSRVGRSKSYLIPRQY